MYGGGAGHVIDRFGQYGTALLYFIKVSCFWGALCVWDPLKNRDPSDLGQVVHCVYVWRRLFWVIRAHASALAEGGQLFL